MKSEIENVIKEMKCGKASGNDDVATEIIKALNGEGIKKITEKLFTTQDIFHLIMSSSIFVCVSFIRTTMKVQLDTEIAIQI